MGKGISVMRTLTATVYQTRTTIVHSGKTNIYIRSSRALKTVLEEEEEENLSDPGDGGGEEGGGGGQRGRYYGH
jgi:hypothetical protein